jgi:hypothetical protein
MLWRHSRGRGTRRSTPIASPCCDGAAWPAQEGREAMGDVVALRQAKAEDEKLAAAADTKLAAGDDGVNNRYGGGCVWELTQGVADKKNREWRWGNFKWLCAHSTFSEMPTRPCQWGRMLGTAKAAVVECS